MFLLALAGGGAVHGEEDVLGCCGGFIILPAVALLTLVAWAADAPWAGWAALVIAGLTYLTAALLVASYKPSDNWEVAEEQEDGRRLVERYGWLTVATAVSLGAIGTRRAVRGLWPQRLLPVRRPTAAERLAVIEELTGRGLLSVEEAADLRRRLPSPEAAAPDAEPDPAV